MAYLWTTQKYFTWWRDTVQGGYRVCQFPRYHFDGEGKSGIPPVINAFATATTITIAIASTIGLSVGIAFVISVGNAVARHDFYMAVDIYIDIQSSFSGFPQARAFSDSPQASLRLPQAPLDSPQALSGSSGYS